MSEGPRLLDVFVNVRPDPQMLEAVKTAHEALLEDLQKRLSEFNTAVGKDTSGAISKVATAVGKLAESMKKLSADTPGDAIANVNAQTENYSKTVEKLRDDLADAAKSQAALTTAANKAAAGGRAGAGTGGPTSPPPPVLPPPPPTPEELQIEEIRSRRAEVEKNIGLLREANRLEIERLRALGQKEFAKPYEEQNRELRAITLEIKAMDAQETNLLTDNARRQEFLDFYEEVGRRVNNAGESVERFANRVRQVSPGARSQPESLVFSKIQEDVAQLFRRQNIRAGIALGVPQARPTGLPTTGELADDLRAQELVVKENAANVKKLRADYDGTTNSVDRLRDAIDTLADSQKRLQTLQLAAKDQGNLYREIANGARDASIAASRLPTTLSEIGDTDLRDKIIQLRREIQDFERELVRLQKAGDFNFVVQSSGLNELLNRLQALQTQAGTSVAEKSTQSLANDSLRLSLAENEIELRTQNELYISRLNATERKAYVERRGEYEKQKVLVGALLQQRDGSLQKELDLNAALRLQADILQDLTGRFTGVANRTTASFNRLQNTAFQVGQAFEDFAVGFQLNGIAGGIRGAANNISFIANDVVSIYTQSAQISEKWKLIAGIGTGIGAALAVTVVPLVANWLENLNDIEVELKSIGDELKEIADTSRLVAQFNADTRDTIDQIGASDSLESLLRTLRDLRKEAESLSLSVLDTFNAFNSGEAVGKFQQNFKPIIEGIKQEIARLMPQFQVGLADLVAPAGFEEQQALAVKADLDATNALIDNYLEINKQINLAANAARQGLFDSQQLNDIQRRFGELETQVDEFAKRADVANDKFAQKAKEAIEPIRQTFEQLRDTAREFENIVNQRIIAASDAAIKKSAELERRQTLLRREIEGDIDAGAEQLLNLNEMSDAYQEMIDVSLEFFQKSGAVKADQIEALRSALQQQSNLEVANEALKEEKTLIDKIRDAEQKLNDIRGGRRNTQSQTVRPEDFVQQLQTAVLSIEPVDKNTDALNKATDELADLNFQLQRVNRLQEISAEEQGIRDRFGGGPLFPRDARRIDELQQMRRNLPLVARPDIPGPFNPLREIPQRAALREEVRLGVQEAIRQGLQELAPNLFRRIDGVGDAVKKKDLGARAQ